MATSDLEAAWWPHSPWWISLRIATPFSSSTQRWKTPVTLRFTSSLLIIAYAPARHCTSLAEISSAGSSLLTRNLRMGWAHDGAVTSSIAKTATATREGGLGCEELESASVCCVAAAPGPGLTMAVLEPGSTMAVPEPAAEVPGPPAWSPKWDPTASGSGGTKMELDSGDGLTGGLRRRWRATPVGIACRVEPIHARPSSCSLSARGT